MPVKITSISIRDWLGLKVFTVNELGEFNLLTGSKGAGKSSVLKAIQANIKPEGFDANDIRNGADESEVLIRLSNGYESQRSGHREKGSKLKVRDEDGKPITSPQKYLDALLGYSPFNPLAFYNADRKEQARLILSGLPFALNAESLRDLFEEADAAELAEVCMAKEEVDYSKHGLEVLSAIKESVYARRHGVGIDVTRLEKAIEQDRREIPDTFDEKRFEGFDYQAEMNKLEEANRVINEHNIEVKHIDQLREAGSRACSRIDQINEQIARLEEERSKLEGDIERIKGEGLALKEKIESFERPQIEDIKQRLTDYDRSRKLLQKLEIIGDRNKELSGIRTLHGRLDEFYSLLSKKIPRAALERMRMPVEGLTIDGDRILVNDVDIKKRSSGEQLEFAVELAIVMSGEAKFLLIDGLERLDKDSFKAFIKRIPKGFQLIMTRVTDVTEKDPNSGNLRFQKFETAEELGAAL